MSKPLILPVGYIYIGKNGIVSTYPQGGGLDFAVTSNEALNKPENLNTLQKLIAEKIYDPQALQTEAAQFVARLQEGIQNLNVGGAILEIERMAREKQPDFALNTDMSFREVADALSASGIELGADYLQSVAERLKENAEFHQRQNCYIRLQAERYLGIINLRPEDKVPYQNLIDKIAADPQAAIPDITAHLEQSAAALRETPQAVVGRMAAAYAEKFYPGKTGTAEQETKIRRRYAEDALGKLSKYSNPMGDVGGVCVWCPEDDVNMYDPGHEGIIPKLLGCKPPPSTPEDFLKNPGCMNKGSSSLSEPVILIAQKIGKKPGPKITMVALEEMVHLLQAHFPWSEKNRGLLDSIPTMLRTAIRQAGISDARFEELMALASANANANQTSVNAVDPADIPSGPKEKVPIDPAQSVRRFMNSMVPDSLDLFATYPHMERLGFEGLAMLFRACQRVRQDMFAVDPAVDPVRNLKLRIPVGGYEAVPRLMPILELVISLEDDLARPRNIEKRHHSFHDIVPVGVELGVGLGR